MTGSPASRTKIKNRFAIDLLTHHTDPLNAFSCQRRPKRPGDHRLPRQWQQKLVAIRAHTPTTARCGRSTDAQAAPAAGEPETASIQSWHHALRRVHACSCTQPWPLASQLERLQALVSLCEQLPEPLCRWPSQARPVCGACVTHLPGQTRSLPFDFEAAPPWRTGPTCWAVCASLIFRFASTSLKDSR